MNFVSDLYQGFLQLTVFGVKMCSDFGLLIDWMVGLRVEELFGDFFIHILRFDQDFYF